MPQVKRATAEAAALPPPLLLHGTFGTKERGMAEGVVAFLITPIPVWDLITETWKLRLGQKSNQNFTVLESLAVLLKLINYSG